jgi:hypothetical protein
MRYSLNPYILLSFLIISCGGSGGSDPEPEPPVVIPPPSAATLIFPDNNTECNEGTVISDNQSSVTFRWTDAQNADSYQLTVRNLNNNTSASSTANSNSATVTLLRGTPYEWFVVSRAVGTNETGTSSTWRFYNQGPGIENYAPFPASVVAPARGSTVGAGANITLEWEGGDIDNDILEYEVYLDNNETPVTLAGTTSDTSLEVSLTSGLTYYWQVITRDQEGNTSRSEIFEFKTS